MSEKYVGLTPHNDAKKGDIASIVLMPGDPLRAKFIAQKYLQNYKLVNQIRGMLAYTGTYKNHKITIMGSGMGNPSMGIYSSELFEFYDVDTIIRIGSTAALDRKINLYDIIVGQKVITDSNYHEAVTGISQKELLGNTDLIKTIEKTYQKMNLDAKLFVGTIDSSDAFYREIEVKKVYLDKILAQKAIGIEMESAALYTNAKRFKKQAITLLAVSDHAITGEATSAQSRQNALTSMIELALNAAINWTKV